MVDRINGSLPLVLNFNVTKINHDNLAQETQSKEVTVKISSWPKSEKSVVLG